VKSTPRHRHRGPHRPRQERARPALTGTDPDRLKEEKARGITIDLGFAHLALENGEATWRSWTCRATSGS
jgi:translation initiation factor 2 gamma subunit (eIF-2gamma)